MKLIRLPVTPFVRKIVLSENDGKEPIAFSTKNEMLFIFLSCSQEGGNHKSEVLANVLTSEVPFYAQTWLVEKIQKNPYATGWILNKMYRRELNKFIYLRVGDGKGVTEAIAEFCDNHDIDIDIDISMDALQRAWRRYKAQQSASKLAKKERQPVRYVSSKSPQKSLNILPYADSELEKIATNYISQNADLFLNTNGKPYAKRESQLRCWIYKNIGQRKGSYIAQKFNIPLKTVFRQIYSFSDLLHTAPAIELPS
jgi:hypothetical protein